jgi:hypothetical protein
MSETKPTPGASVNLLDDPTFVAREHILQFFRHSHLAPPLAAVSRPFGELACQIIQTLPRNPERTVALRKLLEAKDAAVRAFIAHDVGHW